MKRDYIITATFEGKTYKPVIRRTEKGVSDYVNGMYSKLYNKYGIDRTDSGFSAEYGYFDDNFNWIPCGTYHA